MTDAMTPADLNNLISPMKVRFSEPGNALNDPALYSGSGGQNVNRTDSAVRIVHKPGGITVASRQERSQIRNRKIARRILKSKLLEIRQREEAEKHAESKRQQVGTGERSERIRTYNFPQNRIMDHRFGVSAFDLPFLMEGELDLILDPIFECAGRQRLEQILTKQE